jgi:hypothetical protein
MPETTMNANQQQANCIHRYYQHLQRMGNPLPLECAARQWIGKYARLWRLHQQRRTVAAMGCNSSL